MPASVAGALLALPCISLIGFGGTVALIGASVLAWGTFAFRRPGTTQQASPRARHAA